MPNLFFTDLDGTLEDSRHDMANAVIQTRLHFGLKVETYEHYVPFVNKGMRELTLQSFPEVLGEKGTEAFEKKLALTQTIYEQYYFEKIAVHTKLYPGIKELLRSVSQKGKVVVITNKPHYLSVELLTQLEVFPFISLIMGGDSCAETKPSALPLKIAAEKMGFDPKKDTAFMMGDTKADVVCGQAFGAQTIWCKYGYEASIGDLSPDHISDTSENLLKIFTAAVQNK
jgi:HAD superfamily hydrolase (TIGR01549 family)